MVLVDTSIWINLCRKKTPEIGQKIWTLVGRNDAAVCGQVWVAGHEDVGDTASFAAQAGTDPTE